MTILPTECLNFLTDQFDESLGALSLLEAPGEFKLGYIGNIMRLVLAAGIDTKPFADRMATLGITPSRKKIAEAKRLKRRKDEAWKMYSFCMELYGPDRRETRTAHEDYREIEREAQTFQAFHPLEWGAER